MISIPAVGSNSLSLFPPARECPRIHERTIVLYASFQETGDRRNSHNPKVPYGQALPGLLAAMSIRPKTMVTEERIRQEDLCAPRTDPCG